MGLEGKPGKSVLVLDATPIYAGILQVGMHDEYFTTAEILDEISHIKSIRETISMRLGTGMLNVSAASAESSQKVSDRVKKLGEGKLSSADLSILALTLDLKERGFEPTLVSDDFDIQNLAKSISLPYTSYTTKGIKREITWVLYCPACGRTIDSVIKRECEICGSKLKRRPRT